MIITANHEYTPKLYRTSFRIPVEIDLRRLKKYLEKQFMHVKVRDDLLFAQSNETYIHVSQHGKVRINSFVNFDVKHFCQMLIEYANSQKVA